VGATPFRVAPDLIEPLDRRALSLLAKPEHEPALAREDAAAPAGAAIEIENDPLGPMPLWGLDG
jgi:hypothetical protein